MTKISCRCLLSERLSGVEQASKTLTVSANGVKCHRCGDMLPSVPYSPFELVTSYFNYAVRNQNDEGHTRVLHPGGTRQ